jgi:hypothetical protein
MGSKLDTNKAESSVNVASSYPSIVGASEVKKLYKVGDQTVLYGDMALLALT